MLLRTQQEGRGGVLDPPPSGIDNVTAAEAVVVTNNPIEVMIKVVNLWEAEKFGVGVIPPPMSSTGPHQLQLHHIATSFFRTYVIVKMIIYLMWSSSRVLLESHWEGIKREPPQRTSLNDRRPVATFNLGL